MAWIPTVTHSLLPGAWKSYRLRLIDSLYVWDSQEESKQLDGRVMIRRRGHDHDRNPIARFRCRARASLQDGFGADRQEPFPCALAAHAWVQHRPGGGPAVVLAALGAHSHQALQRGWT